MRGRAFVSRPRGGRADSVVALRGQWMVPPFGDAHTHSPDGAFGFAAIRDMYLRLGVFYVQTLTNHRSGRRAVAAQVNVPASIDVVYADAAVTSTGGHPQVLYESLAAYRRFWQTDAERHAAARSTTQDHDAYERLDSLAQLPALVERLAHDTVPLVKLMLLNSDRWSAVAGDSMMAGFRGLDPALAKPLVAAAHALGRRVWAHVETAGDFRVALEAGVDGFAHVPGYGAANAGDSVLGRYVLSDALIRQAGQRAVLMTPTLALASGGITASDTAKRRRYESVAVLNVRALRRAGVRMVVGSDTYSNPDIASNEPKVMAAALGLSALEELQLWAVDTPRAIFPDRRIARLEAGYEASMLALACNPLADRTCMTRISMRLKQGRWLDVPSSP
jgi:imidazolonepropionase-like amidohydrolase